MTQPLQWFKGNLHMHSFWSDGEDFPEMVAGWFKDNGYHFVAFTEHDQHQIGEKWFNPLEKWGGIPRATPELVARYVEQMGERWIERRTRGGVEEIRLKPLAEYRSLYEEPGRFLILNGEEITTTWGGQAAGGQHWINTINTAAAVPPQSHEGSSAQAMLQTFAAASSAGREQDRRVLTFLNHPNYLWNATAEDMLGVPLLRHFEIYTALNQCWCLGDAEHVSAERIWDIMSRTRLREPGGEPVFGLANDDCHGYFPREKNLEQYPGRAWVVVRATQLTSDHIIALTDGDFYCSTGVTLADIEADRRGVRLRITPSTGVRYRTRFIATRRGFDDASHPVTDAGGRPVRTTRRYSEQIGRVVAEVEGAEPSYRFAGDELYVRAVVHSDAQHPVPTSSAPETQKAWTQPIVIGA